MSHGEFWSAASALATIGASLITALSLLFLVIQLHEQRRYTLAEFVNGLGKEFAEFDQVFEVLLHQRDGPTPELPPEELLRCLRFFERVKTLCDVGVSAVPGAASDLALKDPERYQQNLHLYREKHFSDFK